MVPQNPLDDNIPDDLLLTDDSTQTAFTDTSRCNKMHIQITEIELTINPDKTTFGYQGGHLLSKRWTFEELKALMERNLAADFSNCVGLGVDPRFVLNTFVTFSPQAFEAGYATLDSAQYYKLKFEGHDLVLDGDSIGDILANYESGGHQAIRHYLQARYELNSKLFFDLIDSIANPSTPNEY